jgi:hypothetical protein
MAMFPYDPALIAIVEKTPQSIADVLATLNNIDAICADGDGLKWFNWLYLQVTRAVEQRVDAGGFHDPAWLAELDIQFAGLYFSAVQKRLEGAASPGCWRALLAVRNNAAIARIQFAIAGVNAHINHDLPQAIISTCSALGTIPRHGNPQYLDYTAMNATLDPLVEAAKATLHVRLLGDPLPAVSHLEDTVAAWGLAAAREKAWNSSEVLWQLQEVPALAAGFMDTLDGLATVASKVLLVPAP